MPAAQSRSLRLAASLKDLALIRGFVQESAAAAAIAPDELSRILLAVDEAVANVIIHGYAGRGGPLEIEVSSLPGELVIQLRDEAPPFDPTTAPSPDLAAPAKERAPGGLGIYLIRQAVDKMAHNRRPFGGNELTLTK